MDTQPTRWEVLERWNRAALFMADMITDTDFQQALQEGTLTEDDLVSRYGTSDLPTLVSECRADLGTVFGGVEPSYFWASSFWAR